MARVYGYMRVSSKDQNEARQKAKLKDLGVKDDLLFIDKESGKDFSRSDYLLLKRIIQFGDTLIITELDRFGRNKAEIKNELEWFKNKGVRVKILNIPTTLIEINDQEWIMDMVNNVLIEVLASIAEEERLKIKQRQADGIAAARAANKRLGRPPQDIDMNLFKDVYKEWKAGKMTAVKAMEIIGLKKTAFYSKVKRYEESIRK